MLATIIEYTPDKYLLSLRTVSKEFREAVNDEMRRRKSYRATAVTKFPDLAKRGNLEGMQWLTSLFKLTIEDARANHNRTLHCACGGGHLAVVQWLVKRFELTVGDACADNNYILRLACGAVIWMSRSWRRGHLQWSA